MTELTIPPRLAATVVRWEGDRGRAWLADLPGLVAALEAAWNLEIGAPFEPGGQVSWAAPARRRADGLEVVLKVRLPHPDTDGEALGLQTWAGDGAVEVFAHDPARRAVLIERCRPGTGLVELGGTDAAVVAGGRLGARLHAATAPPELPTLASVLDRWADELAGRLQRTFVDPGLDRLAVETMRVRPRACTAPVLLHGDLNPTNVLAARRAPWLAIDPQPMTGEAAYDGARLVTQPDPLLGAEPAATLARRLRLVRDAMEIDGDGLALWCLVGAVEMGAAARDQGEAAAAKGFAALARLVARHLP